MIQVDIVDIIKSRTDPSGMKKSLYIMAARGIWRPIFHVYRRVLRIYSGADPDTSRQSVPFTDEERARLYELCKQVKRLMGRLRELG